MAIVYAREKHATKINFADLSVEHIRLPESWIFKLVDSGIHRRLSEVDYQIDTAYLKSHVKKENERVNNAVIANADELGKLLNQSHESLRKLGVSLPEIDELVYKLQSTDGVLGARMMGGGFGGMIIALVNDEKVLANATLVRSSGAFTFEEFS